MCKRTLAGAQLFHQKLRGCNDRRSSAGCMWQLPQPAPVVRVSTYTKEECNNHEWPTIHHRNPAARRWVVLLLTALLMLSAAPAHAWYGHWGAGVFLSPHGWLYPWSPSGVPMYIRRRLSNRHPRWSSSPPLHRHLGTIATLPKGYYPYVQQCPGGWRPVAPTPSQ